MYNKIQLLFKNNVIMNDIFLLKKKNSPIHLTQINFRTNKFFYTNNIMYKIRFAIQNYI